MIATVLAYFMDAENWQKLTKDRLSYRFPAKHLLSPKLACHIESAENSRNSIEILRQIFHPQVWFVASHANGNIPD